jgi:hypothetical protein
MSEERAKKSEAPKWKGTKNTDTKNADSGTARSFDCFRGPCRKLATTEPYTTQDQVICVVIIVEAKHDHI